MSRLLLNPIAFVKNYVRMGAYDVMAFMESGKWDIEKLITHECPREELETAIQMAGQPDQSLNVVIK